MPNDLRMPLTLPTLALLRVRAIHPRESAVAFIPLLTPAELPASSEPAGWLTPADVTATEGPAPGSMATASMRSQPSRHDTIIDVVTPVMCRYVPY